MEIEKYLLEKGVSPSCKGYDYLIKAIKLIREDYQYAHDITKTLYPKIAECFKTKSSSVQRLIQHSIKHIQMKPIEFIRIAELETRK